MPEPTQQQIQAAIAAVAQRSAKDQAFREKALKEPIAALNEAGNLNLPVNTPIRFVDKFEKLQIVLPPFASDSSEITDEEMLGSVSGGAGPNPLTPLTPFINLGGPQPDILQQDRDKIRDILK